jgi:hypothetical protein
MGISSERLYYYFQTVGPQAGNELAKQGKKK